MSSRDNLEGRHRRLSPAKQALLADRLRNARVPEPRVTATIGANGDGEPPLSFAQERFWILEQFDPGSVFNIRARNLRLTGRLDVAALGRAVVEIIRRHEVLRTCFPMEAGRPVRRVLPNPGTFPAPIDLRGLPTDKREVVARRLATDEMARPFKLQNDLPVRCTLLCLGETDHVLLWTTHHIVFDGWSGEVLQRELAAIYAAFALGKPSPLPEPPLQYAQYAARQRERMHRCAAGAGSRFGGSTWRAPRLCSSCQRTGRGQQPGPSAGAA